MEVRAAITNLWEVERWGGFIALKASNYGSPGGDRAAGQMYMWEHKARDFSGPGRTGKVGKEAGESATLFPHLFLCFPIPVFYFLQSTAFVFKEEMKQPKVREKSGVLKAKVQSHYNRFYHKGPDLKILEAMVQT